MEHHIELGYLVLEFSDPHAVDTVFSEVVGLLGSDSPDGVVWRNDDQIGRAHV